MGGLGRKKGIYIYVYTIFINFLFYNIFVLHQVVFRTMLGFGILFGFDWANNFIDDFFGSSKSMQMFACPRCIEVSFFGLEAAYIREMSASGIGSGCTKILTGKVSCFSAKPVSKNNDARHPTQYFHVLPNAFGLLGCNFSTAHFFLKLRVVLFPSTFP